MELMQKRVMIIHRALDGMEFLVLRQAEKSQDGLKL